MGMASNELPWYAHFSSYTKVMSQPDPGLMPKETPSLTSHQANVTPDEGLLTCCSLCGTEISQCYPWQLWCASCQKEGLPGLKTTLELGLLIGVCAALLANGPLQAGAILVFVLALAFAARVDANIQLLPDNVTLPLLWVGLLLNLQGVWVPLPDAIWGATVGYLALWSLYWATRLATKQEALGYGDFKLTAAIGAWLGIQVLAPLLIGAALLHSGYNLWRRLRKQPLDALPFGPALAIAGIGLMACHLIRQATQAS